MSAKSRKGSNVGWWHRIVSFVEAVRHKSAVAAAVFSIAVGAVTVTVVIKPKLAGGVPPAQEGASPAVVTASAAPAKAGTDYALGSVRGPAIEVALLPSELRGDGSAESATRNVEEALRTLGEAQASVECCVALLDATIGRGHEVVNTVQQGQPLGFAIRSKVRSVH